MIGPDPGSAPTFDEIEAAGLDGSLRTIQLPPPHEMPRVWSSPEGHWYLMRSIPLGSETWRYQTNWTRHLTNALHDAGHAVTRERRRVT